jgi:hypothetical protein
VSSSGNNGTQTIAGASAAATTATPRATRTLPARGPRTRTDTALRPPAPTASPPATRPVTPAPATRASVTVGASRAAPAPSPSSTRSRSRARWA